MTEFAEVFQSLQNTRDLDRAQSEALMHFLMGGSASDSEILAVLNALCDKGPAEVEVLAFAQVMREKANLLDHDIPNLVDTCGTGGGPRTFNISTAAAFVAAGAGVKIAKHGNRSSTGLGSADVLEAVGVRLGESNPRLVTQLQEVGIAFLFAPSHHPAMKHVAAARKQLGRRSVFNLLGPLANPARASRQLIGIYDHSVVDLMANVVRSLGIEKALLAHSRDGLDEVSPCAETEASILLNGILSREILTPEQFGIDRLEPAEIQVGDSLVEAKEKFMEAITEERSPRSQAVIPSAAVAIWLADLESDFLAAAERARNSVRSGFALQKLNLLVNFEGTA